MCIIAVWPCEQSERAVLERQKTGQSPMHKPLHSPKVTVWVAMRHGRPPIGHFFFENENEETVTITAERYINLVLTRKID